VRTGTHRRRAVAGGSNEPPFARGASLAITSEDMSQKTVQFVIGWLLTDEDLRRRFAERPRETLGEIRDQGYELTADELDALARSEPAAWQAMARRIHPRLQRCALR
jgi:hypothetical protein